MTAIQTKKPAEERFVLRNVSWRTYECLLKDFENSSSPRFAYDRGVLEIMSPLAQHEEDNRILAQIVEVVTEEWGWDIRNLGSTTFKRTEMKRGSEPDSCFYLQSAPLIEGKRAVDLATDPPPDLVVEIDVTHSSIDKLSVYAEFGVPEVWRWQDGVMAIFVRGSSGGYEPAEESRVLQPLSAERIGEWLRTRWEMPRLTWLRHIREWARENPPPASAA